VYLTIPQVAEPTTVSDPVGVRWGLRLCISKTLPSVVDVTPDLRTSFYSSVSGTQMTADHTIQLPEKLQIHTCNGAQTCFIESESLFSCFKFTV
jgi:hypothetical protein